MMPKAAGPALGTAPMKRPTAAFTKGATRARSRVMAPAIRRRPPMIPIIAAGTTRIMTQKWNAAVAGGAQRSEEHTSELPSLMRHSYGGFCLKKKKKYELSYKKNDNT